MIGVIWLVLTVGFVIGWVTRLLLGRLGNKNTGSDADLEIMKSEEPEVIDLREISTAVDGKRGKRGEKDERDDPEL